MANIPEMDNLTKTFSWDQTLYIPSWYHTIDTLDLQHTLLGHICRRTICTFNTTTRKLCEKYSASQAPTTKLRATRKSVSTTKQWFDNYSLLTHILSCIFNHCLVLRTDILIIWFASVE